MSPPAIAFRPLGHAGLTVMARWLAEPHVMAWWGDPVEQLALVTEDIDNPLMRGFVASVDGVDAGYVQAYPAAAWSGHPFGALAEGAEAVDMFLGEPSLLGRGLGGAILAAFADRLLAEGATRVLIDPDVANGRAVAAYARAGFEILGEARAADGPVVVMARSLDRNRPAGGAVEGR